MVFVFFYLECAAVDAAHLNSGHVCLAFKTSLLTTFRTLMMRLAPCSLFFLFSFSSSVFPRFVLSMHAKTLTADVTQNNQKTSTAKKTKKDEKIQCGAYKCIVKAQQRLLFRDDLVGSYSLSVAAQRRKRVCVVMKEEAS